MAAPEYVVCRKIGDAVKVLADNNQWYEGNHARKFTDLELAKHVASYSGGYVSGYKAGSLFELTPIGGTQ